MSYLDSIIRAAKSSRPLGITSVCSAHPVVLEAALMHGVMHDTPVLIEATCNQVNQYGGYTGVTPAQFIMNITKMAENLGFPQNNLILGGDHLGPLVWSNEPAASAMEKAKILVHEYVQAGFSKIHLDCSMRCGDDTNLPVEEIAHRSAELAKVAEDTFADKNDADNEKPNIRFVIGSEVPAAGGAKAGEDHLTVTNPADAAETIHLTKSAFISSGLSPAWDRVIALVVQPGVEFGDTSVHEYNRTAAAGLTNFIKDIPGLVYEAHSTDYQTREALKHMVEDNFAILKVGPALTFAYREAVFALAEMEEILCENPSHVREIVESAMLDYRGYWEKHYGGNVKTQKFARQFSYSDRIRYYWNTPLIQKALNLLIHNLGENAIPLTLISQYLPIQYEKIRAGQIKNAPHNLLLDKVMNVLDDYACAVGVV